MTKLMKRAVTRWRKATNRAQPTPLAQPLMTKKRGRKPGMKHPAPYNSKHGSRYGPLLASGMSFSEVARQCGASRQAVAQWAKRWANPEGARGVGRPKTLDVTFEQIAGLRRQLDADGNQLTWTAIAEKLGASRSSVLRIYREGKVAVGPC